MNFEYVLLILITLAFLGVRYLVVTLYIVFPEKKTSFAYLKAKVIWSGQFLICHWLVYHLLKQAHIEPPKMVFRIFLSIALKALKG